MLHADSIPCQALLMLVSLAKRTDLPAASEAARRLRRNAVLWAAGDAGHDDTNQKRESGMPDSEPKTDPRIDDCWNHAAWSRAQDEQLVVFVQWLAQKRGTSPKELKAAELEAALSTEAGRFELLKGHARCMTVTLDRTL